jgi:hypothetical protein
MKRDDILKSEQSLENYEVNAETLTIAKFISNKVVVANVQKNIDNNKFDVPEMVDEFCKKLTKKELAYLLLKDMTEKIDLIIAFETMNFTKILEIVEINKTSFAAVANRSEEDLVNVISDMCKERKS